MNMVHTQISQRITTVHYITGRISELFYHISVATTGNKVTLIRMATTKMSGIKGLISTPLPLYLSLPTDPPPPHPICRRLSDQNDGKSRPRCPLALASRVFRFRAHFAFMHQSILAAPILRATAGHLRAFSVILGGRALA